jgi:hypothetical protein
MEGLMAEEFDQERARLGRPFFLAITPTNNDGTTCLASEGIDAHASQEAAIEQASKQTWAHGEDIFIYECRPLKRVRRPAARVEDVEVS